MNDIKANDESRMYRPQEHRDVVAHKATRNVDIFRQAPKVIALGEDTERATFSEQQ